MKKHIEDATFIVGATILGATDRITRPYRTRKYNKMIKASQKKLSTLPEPVSYTRIYA